MLVFRLLPIIPLNQEKEPRSLDSIKNTQNENNTT